MQPEQSGTLLGLVRESRLRPFDTMQGASAEGSG